MILYFDILVSKCFVFYSFFKNLYLVFFLIYEKKKFNFLLEEDERSRTELCCETFSVTLSLSQFSGYHNFCSLQ